MLTAVCIFVVGLVIWLIGRQKGKKAQSFGGGVTMPGDDSAHRARNEMLAINSQYSGLPAVPVNPLQYDGWFEEVRKRIRMRSLGLTVEQERDLQNQLNALQGARLIGVETESQLHQALARLAVVKQNAQMHAKNVDLLQAKQGELEVLKVDAEIVKMQKQLADLKDPPRPPALPTAPAPPTRESREEKFFSEWSRLQEQRTRRLAACNREPRCEEMVNLYFDNEEERLKEGR